MNEKSFRLVKVVSSNFAADIISSVQNMFGTNLSAYEKMIDKAIDQIQKDIVTQKIKVEWYRYEITQLTNGAVAVLMYGDKK